VPLYAPASAHLLDNQPGSVKIFANVQSQISRTGDFFDEAGGLRTPAAPEPTHMELT
jgi:hypothetical protein